jgi:6-phospho-3-hexuloisomerase
MDSRETDRSRPWLAVGREITDLLDRLDPEQFDALSVELAQRDRRWFFSGQGRSGLSAQMAAMRFMHLGAEVHYLGEVTAPSVREGDALLLISGSGETPVSVNFARIAKAEGASVIVLTTKPASTLAGIADLVVTIPVVETGQFGGSLFEQSALILLDAVVLDVAAKMDDPHATMLHRHTNMQ